jgi:hypothetical protein
MLRKRREAAQKVAERLWAVEEAIDVALTRAAELNAVMPAARTDARLPAMIGQDALDRATEALALLVQARRRMVETHQSLDEARAQIGLREFAAGDSFPKPPIGQTVEHIRAVA